MIRKKFGLFALAILLGTSSLHCGSGGSAATPLSRPGPDEPDGVLLGTSGGNIFDSSSRYCCSGTLGGLVQDGTATRYILSNNHVLARSNRAFPGEGINHPGLIDQGCSRRGVIGELSVYEELVFGTRGSPGGPNYVDAAIGLVTDANVVDNGFVTGIGPLSTEIVDPFLSQMVKKSGRTTGLTSGRVAAVGVDILVSYSSECGGLADQFAIFRNQFVVTGGGFSDSGDSGALIVEETGSSDPPRAVGLLFAASSTSTIANPIRTVLDTFGVSMVGETPAAGPMSAETTASAASTEQPAAALTANVVSLTYDVAGDALVVTLRVGDDFGRPALDALVDIMVEQDGSLFAVGTSAVTGDGGEAAFVLQNAPDGNYTVTVTGVQSDALVFSAAMPVPMNLFAKGQDPVPAAFYSLSDSTAGATTAAAPSTVPTVQGAAAAKQRYSGAIMAIDGVIGHGVGLSDSGEPVIELYAESASAFADTPAPTSLDGVPCRVVVTGAFNAL